MFKKRKIQTKKHWRCNYCGKENMDFSFTTCPECGKDLLIFGTVEEKIKEEGSSIKLIEFIKKFKKNKRNPNERSLIFKIIKILAVIFAVLFVIGFLSVFF